MNDTTGVNRWLPSESPPVLPAHHEKQVYRTSSYHLPPCNNIPILPPGLRDHSLSHYHTIIVIIIKIFPVSRRRCFCLIEVMRGNNLTWFHLFLYPLRPYDTFKTDFISKTTCYSNVAILNGYCQHSQTLSMDDIVFGKAHAIS